MFFKALIIISVLTILIPEVESGTCDIGRIACVASCKAQNCATGYCTKVPGGICRCSRCSNGPWR